MNPPRSLSLVLLAGLVAAGTLALSASSPRTQAQDPSAPGARLPARAPSPEPAPASPNVQAPAAGAPAGTPAAGSMALAAADAALVALAAKVRPSVVRITATERMPLPFPVPGDAPNARPRTFDMDVSYSGVVLDAQGYILTVADLAKAQSLKVTFSDGRTVDATLYAADGASDIGLVRVDPRGHALTPAVLGDSDAVKPGHFVLHVGNPYGLMGTIAPGIITGIDRVLQIAGRSFFGILQTNADVNPGDPGGLAANRSGEMIGMIWSTYGRVSDDESPAGRGVPFRGGAQGDNGNQWQQLMNQLYKQWLRSQNRGRLLEAEGINFILPANTLRHVVRELKQHRRVRRARLGLSVVEHNGLVTVRYVDPHGPCAGKLKPGDVVLTAKERPIRELADLYRILLASTPGMSLALTIRRGEKTRAFAITLVEAPRSSRRGESAPPGRRPRQPRQPRQPSTPPKNGGGAGDGTGNAGRPNGTGD